MHLLEGGVYSKAAFNRVNMVYQYLVFEQLTRYQAFGNIGTKHVRLHNDQFNGERL